MTIKELKEYIANLPDEGEVFVHRVEDIYIKERNWKTYLKEGWDYHQALAWNEKIDSGIYLNKEEYPLMVNPEYLNKYTEEQLEEFKEQYINTFCCVNYDNKNLYITSHY